MGGEPALGLVPAWPQATPAGQTGHFCHLTDNWAMPSSPRAPLPGRPEETDSLTSPWERPRDPHPHVHIHSIHTCAHIDSHMYLHTYTPHTHALHAYTHVLTNAHTRVHTCSGWAHTHTQAHVCSHTSGHCACHRHSHAHHHTCSTCRPTLSRSDTPARRYLMVIMSPRSPCMYQLQLVPGG